MVGQFNDLHQTVVGGATTDDYTMRLQALTKLIIKLIAMAMSLKHNSLSISFVSFGARSQAADPVAKAHRTAFICHITLGIHQIYHRAGGLWIKFGTVRSRQVQYIAGKLNNRHLHTQA